jgi:membrane protease YdiL (CAAX protease family)
VDEASTAAGTRSAAWVTAGGLLLCLIGAVSVRVALAGESGPRHVLAGGLFGLLLVVPVVLLRWRPTRPTGWAVTSGAAAGLALGAVTLLQLGTADRDVVDLPLWLTVVLLVGTAEEVLLRGVLVDVLLPHCAPVLVVAVSAVAFGLMHVPLYGWDVLVLDTAVGVLLAGLRLWTGGVAAPVTAHGTANLCSWWVG